MTDTYWNLENNVVKVMLLDQSHRSFRIDSLATLRVGELIDALLANDRNPVTASNPGLFEYMPVAKKQKLWLKSLNKKEPVKNIPTRWTGMGMHLVFKGMDEVFPIQAPKPDKKEKDKHKKKSAAVKPKDLSTKTRDREKRWAKSKDEMAKEILTEMRDFITPTYQYKPDVHGGFIEQSLDQLQMSSSDAASSKVVATCKEHQDLLVSWVNMRLKESKHKGAYVSNLHSDLKSGVVLIQLLEALTPITVTSTVREPRANNEMIHNLNGAVSAIEKLRIKMNPVVIGPDFQNGRVTLIFGTFYAIMEKYVDTNAFHGMKSSKWHFGDPPAPTPDPHSAVTGIPTTSTSSHSRVDSNSPAFLLMQQASNSDLTVSENEADRLIDAMLNDSQDATTNTATTTSSSTTSSSRKPKKSTSKKKSRAPHSPQPKRLSRLTFDEDATVTTPAATVSATPSASSSPATTAPVARTKALSIPNAEVRTGGLVKVGGLSTSPTVLQPLNGTSLTLPTVNGANSVSLPSGPMLPGGYSNTMTMPVSPTSHSMNNNTNAMNNMTMNTMNIMQQNMNGGGGGGGGGGMGMMGGMNGMGGMNMGMMYPNQMMMGNNMGMNMGMNNMGMGGMGMGMNNNMGMGMNGGFMPQMNQMNINQMNQMNMGNYGGGMNMMGMNNNSNNNNMMGFQGNPHQMNMQMQPNMNMSQAPSNALDLDSILNAQEATLHRGKRHVATTATISQTIPGSRLPYNNQQ